MDRSEIIKLYIENHSNYDLFKNHIISKLEGYLESKNIKIHNIYGRVKDKTSISEKIDRKGYENISDITDIIGVRIITFFQEDVDIIHKLISEIYNISFYDSIDKRKSEPTEFGYKSLHLIIKGKGKFDGLFAEIQIRTILQHAWAEIEHGIGYKSSFGISNSTRRSFSRISGMLESCDIEFSNINKYKGDYNIDLDNEMILLNNTVFNESNLRKFILNSKIMNFIDNEIANYYGNSKLGINIINLNKELYRLKYFGIETFVDLTKKLIKYKDQIIYISSKLIKIPKGDTPKGISIFYLGHVLVSEKSIKDIVKYLEEQTNINNINLISKKLYEYGH